MINPIRADGEFGKSHQYNPKLKIRFGPNVCGGIKTAEQEVYLQ